MTMVIAICLAGPLTACGGQNSSEGKDKGGESTSGKATTIRFALDWTPNTNHTGLYVAKNKGYFADAGIDLEIIPFNTTSPDTLVDSGQANFGIGFQELSSISKAAGARIQSVLAVQQNWTAEISVLADRKDIKTPANLDGLTYGGFGGASEEAIMRGVIQKAGGKGDFKSVSLGTSAYEALYSKKVDFAIPFIAWEGLEAKKQGIKLKNFAYTDYGFPPCYQVIVIGNQEWLEKNPDLASKFVQALARGYEDSVKDPAGSAKILQDENKDLLTDLDFLVESQKILSSKFMLDENGKFGKQTEKQWHDLGSFLYQQKLLTDDSGKQLTQEPNWSTFFTNKYLEK